jgi:ABC-type multidrug transport system ATPase subunit
VTLYAPSVDAPAPPRPDPRTRASVDALTLTALSKRWRKDLPPVLDGVSLALEPGTITWVGGRNGAGKTTMLRIAAGLIDPDRGRAEAWGIAAREHRARYQRLVAFLPAGDRGLYARLTVRRHLDFWARISMVPREGARRRVEEAIDAFALRGLADRRVDRMSMGQRQRLRIAMTFLPRPAVVLLDEPLTSLDADGTALLQWALRELVGRDGAALWCSPSEESVAIAFDARMTIEHGALAPA